MSEMHQGRAVLKGLMHGETDPHPHYHRLRAVEPVHWVAPFGPWLITGYAEAAAALRDVRLGAIEFTEKEKTIPREMRDDLGTFFRIMRSSLEHANPPAHTRNRRLLSQSLTPRMVDNVRPHIREIVEELLDACDSDGRLDILEDFTRPLVSHVIGSLVGVPREERAQCRKLFETYFQTFAADFTVTDVRHSVERSSADLMEYFRTLLVRRRQHRTLDLMSVLLTAAEKDGAVSDTDLLCLCIQLLLAGGQATPSFLANAIVTLWQSPDQLTSLQQNPSLMPRAVEEMLRYDSTIRLLNRIALRNVEIGGSRIGKGQRVLILLAAANRDPARFADPDRLDLTRGDSHHLTLGHGIHFCLGAALARAVIPEVFGAMLRRPATFALAMDNSAPSRPASFPKFAPQLTRQP